MMTHLKSDCSYDRECAIVVLKLMLPVLFKFIVGYGIRKFSRAWNRLTLNGRQHVFVFIYCVNLLLERKLIEMGKIFIWC
jgi:hypothetical protein